MKNQLFKTSETGNIGIIAAILIVAALFMWQIWSPTILTKASLGGAGGPQACRPEDGPPLTLDLDGQGNKTYKLLKTRVLVSQDYIKDYTKPDSHVDKKLENQKIDGKDYDIFFVKDNASGDTTYQTSKGEEARFNPIGLIFAVGSDYQNYPGSNFYVARVYIEESKYSNLPKEIFDCVDSELQKHFNQPLDITPTEAVTMTPEPTKQTIQIQYIKVDSNNGRISIGNWFSFHCKPIIYLYPEQKETVSVKLNPKGSLLETIPTYPESGWVVTAYPNGKIEYQNKTYPYLYYESKIHDSEVKVPTTGYVRSYSDLQAFFTFILPQTGLNVSEAKEFNDYWVKALPYAPYYFVGFMDSTSIDHIEPLTISPKPDTIIRVRAYFKALEKPTVVTEPKLLEPSNREGFTVVEWGGMVKTDMNHPFTCSQ